MTKKIQALCTMKTLEHYAVFYVFVLVGSGLLYVAFQHIDIGFLQLHSIDEYVFHGSLRHMYDSIMLGKLSGLFGYGFYQYGFIYFAINLVLAAPAIATNHTDIAIIMPRIMTALSALLSLGIIYKFSRLYLGTKPATLVTLVFVSMPAFWYNATWFHPDWSMTMFLLGTVYFLARDNSTFTRHFHYAVISYGLAIAFKYQAITAFPLLGLYIAYPFFTQIRVHTFVRALKRITLLLVSSIGIFIFCNPYILHPMGWRAFSQAFIGNMLSNATNHGMAASATLADKVNNGIGDYYTNVIFLFIILLGTLWLALHYGKKSAVSLSSILAINFLINIGYLFFFVNKDWQTYYLPVITMGLLSLIYFLLQLNPKQQLNILMGIVCIQVGTYATTYLPLLENQRQGNAPDYITYSDTEITALYTYIESELQGKTDSHTIVLLSAYTPFPNESLYIPYEGVKVIFGALTEDSFDLNTYIAGQRNYWGTLKTDSELATSFKPVDYIVLRKDIPYIDIAKIAAARDKTGYQEGARIVANLYAGHYDFEVMSENDKVVLFKKITSTP